MIDTLTRLGWLDQRSVEDWEADPAQDEALAAALALDEGPAAPRILAAIESGTWTR